MADDVLKTVEPLKSGITFDVSELPSTPTTSSSRSSPELLNFNRRSTCCVQVTKIPKRTKASCTIITPLKSYYSKDKCVGNHLTLVFKK